MFFTAHVGAAGAREAWARSCREHATWLGLEPRFHQRSLEGAEGAASLCWMGPAAGSFEPEVQEDGGRLVTTAAGAGPPGYEVGSPAEPTVSAAAPFRRNTITVGISKVRGETAVAVPPATPEHAYYARDGRGGWLLGTDLRLMIRLAGLELDALGVYGLFEFGATPAPRTISRPVRRVPPGHVAFMGGARSVSLKLAYRTPPEDPSRFPGAEAAEKHVVDSLDDVLAGLPPSPLLYFSGGIDSTLLAMRLLALGRDDFRLFNFSFGPEDPEALHARKVASLLNVDCDTVSYEPAQVEPVLERVGRDYSYPFRDPSVVPTNVLVHASADRSDRRSAVIDGTGADGLFAYGLRYDPWRKVYRLPGLARRAASGAYRLLRGWRSDSAPGHLGRVLDRSARYSLPHAAIVGKNSLDRIAYRVPQEMKEGLAAAMFEHIQAMGEGRSPEAEIAILDTMHVGVEEMAGKCHDPLLRRGFAPVFPFLHPAVLSSSFAIPWEVKGRGGEEKFLLKRLVAEKLPRELVYRPKSGFVPPTKRINGLDAVQAVLRDEVLRQNHPLYDFLDVRAVRSMADRARAREPLSIVAHRFLWLLVFTACWMRGVRG